MKTFFALVALAFLTPSAPAAEARCVVPQDLQKVMAAKYPNAKMVELTDLSDDDRAKFTIDHGDDCPGVAKVDFYGDGSPTFAIALSDRDSKGEVVRLVLAHRLGTEWRLLALDKANGTGGVVWSESAGKYKSVYGTKEIRATHPVIMFCGYSSWAIIYAWVNGKVAKVWLQD